MPCWQRGTACRWGAPNPVARQPGAGARLALYARGGTKGMAACISADIHI